MTFALFHCFGKILVSKIFLKISFKGSHIVFPLNLIILTDISSGACVLFATKLFRIFKICSLDISSVSNFAVVSR